MILRQHRNAAHKITLLTFLLLLAVEYHTALLLQEQPSKASIKGVVFSAVGLEPLPGARVTLITHSVGAASSTASTATADSAGNFVFTDIAPGTYRLAASRDGYVGQEHGQPSPRRNGVALVLAAGQTIDDVAVHLTPTGSVNGRLRDALGQPLEGVQIQALRQGYSTDGKKTFQVARSAVTNDRGEYRLYWIPPGRYVILAITSDSDAGRIGGLIHVKVAAMFYPGVTEPATASVITIRPADDIAGIDWVLSRPAVHIRGRVVDPATGRAPPSAGIVVVQRDVVVQGGIAGPRFSGASRPSSYDPATGTFETPGLTPGVYWVSALLGLSGNFAGPNGSNASGATIGDQVMVTAMSDASNVLLYPTPPFSVTGRFHVDDAGLAAASDIGSVRISLQGAPAIIGTGPVPVPGLDGSFVLNIGPGQYKLNVTRPPDFYIKQARFGQTDILGQTVTIQRPGSEVLQVVLSPKGGRIDGTIFDARMQPMAEADVALVPNLRDRIDLYQSVRTDGNGRFTIRGIPPGDYKLFAWEYIDPNEHFDPMLLLQSEPAARSLRIVESSRETADMRTIARE